MANILVVDDYEDAAESMALWLKLNGHDVEIARDGYQAIEIARRRPPNFVLLDLGLPRLDGYQVASTLRQELGALPVIIAVTGYGSKEDRGRALAAGCDYYCLKPINPSALMTLLSASDTPPATPVDERSSSEPIDACDDSMSGLSTGPPGSQGALDWSANERIGRGSEPPVERLVFLDEVR